MTIEEVLSHFGSIQRVADVTGVTYQAVYKWREEQRIPGVRQYHFEVLTKGQLLADREDVA